MKTLLAAVALVAMVSTSYAEIICTPRGCWETGGRIFRNGGRMTPGMTIVNQRDGHKDSGKPIRIRRVY
jgi:hypothetical protein